MSQNIVESLPKNGEQQQSNDYDDDGQGDDQQLSGSQLSDGNGQTILGEKGTNYGRWTNREHQRFLDGLRLYGKDWRKIEDHIGTRTGAQIRSHAQKYYLKLDKVKNKDRKPLGVIPMTSAPKDLKKKLTKPIGTKPGGSQQDSQISGGGAPEQEEDQQQVSQSQNSLKKPAEQPISVAQKPKKKKQKRSDGNDPNLIYNQFNPGYPGFYGQTQGFPALLDLTPSPTQLLSFDPLASLTAFQNPLQPFRNPYDTLGLPQLSNLQTLGTTPAQTNNLLNQQFLQEQLLLKQLALQQQQQQQNQLLGQQHLQLPLLQQQLLAQQTASLNPLAQLPSYNPLLDQLSLLNSSTTNTASLLGAQQATFPLNNSLTANNLTNSLTSLLGQATNPLLGQVLQPNQALLGAAGGQTTPQIQTLPKPDTVELPNQTTDTNGNHAEQTENQNQIPEISTIQKP